MEHPFKKFMRQKSNAAIKEQIRQDKKQEKKKRAKAIEEHFEKKRNSRQINKDPKNKQSGVKVDPVQKTEVKAEKMPLNKYLAHCGISSRREAAEIIEKGGVKVNGKSVKEPGFKVSDLDEVDYNGTRIHVTKNLVYILLNKPKDHITTTDDPQNRKTVLNLIQNATKERVYPVGRLDRNTSGVLLLTNDGELTQRLTHPSYNVRKIYEVKLDRQLTKMDFEKIAKGLILDDGEIIPDALAYADSKDKSVIGIEIHSGRNRIVRRIFEHLGYEVKNLDRVMYAGLTKKNVERGKYRFLQPKEIRLLKFMGKQQPKKSK